MRESIVLPDPIRVTLLVTREFEHLGIQYLIGGSFASTIYGKVRTTQNADIIASMQLQHVPMFIGELQSEFYIDENVVIDAIQRNSSFNIIHRDTMFKVDVFIPSMSAYTQSQFDRARKQTVALGQDISANFASPEDTILAKLVWFRMGGNISEKQWEDVIGVLKVRLQDLDFEYLRQWANELQVLDLLDKAIKET